MINHGEPIEPDSLKNFQEWGLDSQTGDAVIYCNNGEVRFRFFDEHELIRFGEADMRKLYLKPMNECAEEGSDYSQIVATFNKFVKRAYENRLFTHVQEFDYETD